jgi:pilus assembly protein TadC
MGEGRVKVQVVRVSIDSLREIMASGDMLLPALSTCYMALAALERQGRLT